VGEGKSIHGAFVASRRFPLRKKMLPSACGKDQGEALAELTPMLATYQHADVYNLMDFSLRKTGDYQQAYTFYRKALDFDPDHKGALEYLGELYVETGQIDKAKENAVRLKQLCPPAARSLPILKKPSGQPQRK
jgi:tetratricopeptide (TPR) repeat protein